MTSDPSQPAERLQALDSKARAVAAMEATLGLLDAMGAGLVACHQSLALELLRDWAPETEAGSCLGLRDEQGDVARQ